MKIVDRGNAFDKANNRDYGNSNPNNLTRITEEVYRFYIQFPECEFCPCNSGLGEPLCKHPENCRFRNHDCSSRNKKSKIKKPVIETRTYVGNPNSIFLSRTTLVFLYKNNIPFIFRAGRHNNIIQHHRDGNPLNDRVENISMLLIPTHVKLHMIERKLLKVIRSYASLLNEDVNNEFKLAFDTAVKLRAEAMNIVTEEAVWKMIEDECKELGVEAELKIEFKKSK